MHIDHIYILIISTTIRYLCEWLHRLITAHNNLTNRAGLLSYHSNVNLMLEWPPTGVFACVCASVFVAPRKKAWSGWSRVLPNVKWSIPRLQCVGGGSSSHIDRSQCRVVGVDECIHHAALCWIVGGRRGNRAPHSPHIRRAGPQEAGTQQWECFNTGWAQTLGYLA